MLMVALCVLFLVPRNAVAQRTVKAEQVDRSIVRALKYIANQQTRSGAWQVPKSDSCAVTSLAIMAFMSAGHVPGEGPYGDRMEAGIRWVLDHQQNNGMFVHRAGHGPMYAHGITTLMLAEVVGMVETRLAKRVRTALERGIVLILKAQMVRKGPQHAGGWRYQTTSADSDLSVTGWQLLALRGAKDVGCDVSKESIDYAVDYVRKCATRGGGFGYQPNSSSTPTRAGTGILCLEICGKHKAKETMAAADFLVRRPLQYHDSYFFYGVYYCSVGMFKVGDKHWESTRNHLGSLLLSTQAGDGSWIMRRGSERGYGPVYSTSLAVLALAVDYQYLPIYQK
jgi:prenyltransferase beta subunit